MRRGRLLALLLGSTTAACVLPGVAHAQLEEILVTANKRTEALRDVAASVTVLTADRLERVQAQDLTDIAKLTPGLTFRDAGGVGLKSVTLRGLTSNSSARILGVYVDDVPYGTSTVFGGNTTFALDLGLVDLAQVEVLRGPQGTLYGASALGGILKYVTKAPNVNAWEARGDVGFAALSGGEMDHQVRGSVNAPLVQGKVAVRASAYHNYFGGFVDDPGRGKSDVDGAEQYGGRAQVLFQPTDNLKIKLGATSQDIRRDNLSAVDYNVVTRQPVNGLTQSRQLDEKFTQRFRLFSGSADYDMGFATATLVLANQSSRADVVSDGTSIYRALLRGALGIDNPLYPVLFGQGVNKNTGEFRLTSPTGKLIDWQVGVFYTKEQLYNNQALVGIQANGQPSPINFVTFNLPSSYREIAGFANGTIHITDTWDFSAGVRAARDDQVYTQRGTGLLGSSLPRASARESIFLYQASTRWRFIETGTAYARVATGYRPGGPNAVAVDPATGVALAPPTFGSDKTTNYEVGVKMEPTRWLSFDVSAFYVNWKTIQLTAARNGFSVIANGGNARSKGLELQGAVMPVQGLTIYANAAYTDAYLVDPAPDLSGLAGDRLPTIPHWSWTLGADYEFPAFAGWNGVVGAAWNYVGDRNSGFPGSRTSPNYHMDSYNTIDLRAGLSRDNYTITAYIKNLADDRSVVNAPVTVSGGSTTAQFAVLRPRQIGATFAFQF